MDVVVMKERMDLTVGRLRMHIGLQSSTFFMDAGTFIGIFMGLIGRISQFPELFYLCKSSCGFGITVISSMKK